MSILNTFVSPGPTSKSPQRILLSIFGLMTTPSGGMNAFGTKVPKLLSHPGSMISQI
ncbi:hypothetical protein D3C87_2054930 [compost metagenome]